jgi:hypothetical protein
MLNLVPTIFLVLSSIPKTKYPKSVCFRQAEFDKAEICSPTRQGSISALNSMYESDSSFLKALIIIPLTLFHSFF